jgi:hypothetical protein
MTFGNVAETEASNSASAANAAPVSIDIGTQKDASGLRGYNPERIVPADTSGAPPPPGVPDQLNDEVNQAQQQIAPASCSDLGAEKDAKTSDGARVACDNAGQQTSAGAAFGGCIGAASPGTPAGACTVGTPSGGAAAWPTIQLGYVASSTKALHTSKNESVAEAVAVARGVSLAIPGGATVSIGEVATMATSIAAGRRGTAKATFARRISNVIVRDPGGNAVFACGFDGVTVATAVVSSPSCDPRQLTDQVSQVSAVPVEFLTPEPDAGPLAGSPGGAQAEVIKSKYLYFNDAFTNADLGYEIPGLQIVTVADAFQPSRVVLNLAAVHVESHDQIGVAPPPRPALAAPSLELTLLDDSTPPAPLSGATFTVQGPGDAAPLTCLTAADGIGTCTFAKLPPGSYTISETTAPPGYAPVKDYALTLEAGKAYKTSFVNLPAIGAVKVNLSAPGDEAKPLEGGVFAMFKGDDVLGTPVATCTTDAEGGCGFDKVPLGKYTMSQVSAPEGYLVTDDVAFELAEPRQTVTVTFVDGTPEIAAKPPTVIPGKPAVPAKVIPGKPGTAPRTMVLPALDGTGTAGLDALEPASYDTSSVPPPLVSAQDSDAMGPISPGEGGLAAIPARLARLAVHTPQQAVLLLFVWLILGMPVYLWVRRRQFILETERV